MNTFLEMLAHLSIVVTIAIGVVLIGRAPLRRFAGASLAYASWSLIPIAIVAFVIAKNLPTARFGLTIPSAMQAPAISVSSAESASRIGFDAALGWLAVWFIGMCVAAIWFAIRQYRFVHSFGSLARDDTMPTTTPLFRAAETSTGPLVLGLFRPRIVIPADFYERYSEAEQRLVIAHELAHVRRGDLYANAVATALQIVFWFNPLIHWAARRMRFDQELACDVLVLGASPDLADQADRAKTYAAAVVKTAFPKHASPLACHWQSRHPLNERILNMTAAKPNTASRRVAQFGLAALITASCYGALAFADKTPNPGAGQFRIDFEYTGNESESPPHRNEKRKSFAMVLDANKAGSLKVGSIKVCEFEFAVSRIDEQKVRVRFPHTCNDERNPDANLIVKLGEPATIENGGDLPGVSWSHSLKFVVTDGNAKPSSKSEPGTITRTSFRRN